MKEKQIEEMAKVVGYTYTVAKGVGAVYPSPKMVAMDLYNAGFRKQNEWISVEDRLPTDQKDVLCYYGFDRGDGDLDYMMMGTLCYFCFDVIPHWQHADHNLVVTHWMPLPDAPKGGEQK